MHVLNGWPQTNFVEYLVSIGTAKYTKSIIASKENVVVLFFQNYDYFILYDN